MLYSVIWLSPELVAPTLSMTQGVLLYNWFGVTLLGVASA